MGDLSLPAEEVEKGDQCDGGDDCCCEEVDKCRLGGFCRRGCVSTFRLLDNVDGDDLCEGWADACDRLPCHDGLGVFASSEARRKREEAILDQAC